MVSAFLPTSERSCLCISNLLRTLLLMSSSLLVAHVHRPRDVRNVVSSDAMLGRAKSSVTMKGYRGIVPSRSEIGDKIVAFIGMQTTSVRRMGNGNGGMKYQNIGECYVHGLMNEEIFDTGWWTCRGIQSWSQRVSPSLGRP